MEQEQNDTEWRLGKALETIRAFKHATVFAQNVRETNENGAFRATLITIYEQACYTLSELEGGDQ